jgi:hypothetical protein
MGGSGQLWVPPASFSFTTINRPVSAPLAPGYPDGTKIVTGTNLAQPNNLVASSPPTLLEEFEIDSLAIAWGVAGVLGTAAEVACLAKLYLLVNDRRATTLASEANDSLNPTGVWVADLVNPLRIGARDRLGLSVELKISTVHAQATMYFMIAGVPNGTGGALASEWTLAESTISYAVLDVPASARL